MDRDRKTEGGASSKPAFDVSQMCLRVRGVSMAVPLSLLQPCRLSLVKAVHAWNTMMSPVVQCQPWECFYETCRLVCLMVRLLVQSGVSESSASGGNQGLQCPLPE